jgi:hypothetical protein
MMITVDALTLSMKVITMKMKMKMNVEGIGQAAITSAIIGVVFAAATCCRHG